MTRTKPRILWVSDTPRASSGLARVSREILTRVAQAGTFEVACYACFDETVPEDLRELPFRVIPGDHSYGRETLPEILQEVKPDVLVTCGDLWMMEWLAVWPEKEGVQWVAYCMPDGRGLPEVWRWVLSRADRTVVCSKFGFTLLGAALFRGQIHFIPFGVDPDVFRPLEHRDRLRADAELEDKFVVGCVARNQFRKQIPLLVRAFARFASQRDNALLYLHTDPLDGAGSNLIDLIVRYGIAEKVRITGGAKVTEGVSDEALCRFYNLLDVFVLPTMGEGFGLPILEAMACGLPVLATDCSAVTELVREHGKLIRVKEWLNVGPYNVELAVADVGHLVELLEQLHEDPELRGELGSKGRELAEWRTWDRCSQQWIAYLEDLAPEPVSTYDTSRRVGSSARTLSVLVCFSGRASLRSWIESGRHEVFEALAGRHESIEWIALIDEHDDASLLADVRGAVSPDAIVIRLPAGTPREEQLRAGVGAAAGQTVWIVPPDGDPISQGQLAAAQTQRKEIRVFSDRGVGVS